MKFMTTSHPSSAYPASQIGVNMKANRSFPHDRHLKTRRSVILAGLVSICAGCNNQVAKSSAMHPIPNPRNATLNPDSNFVKYWPGDAAIFRLNESLTVAIPPQYQQFWIQKNKVARESQGIKSAPLVDALGFEFHMPSYEGYNPDNYEIEFHPDRIDVVNIFSPSTLGGVAPAYSDIDGALARMDGALIDTKNYTEIHGLRCFSNPHPDSYIQSCLGVRQNGERFFMTITPTPHPAWIRYPSMQTTYYTNKYGGLQVTWRAHMKHLPHWLEIDTQIWKFIEAWAR